MEDIRLGRKLATGAKTVQASNVVASPAAPADPRRTRIAFHTCGLAVRVAPEGISSLQDGAFSCVSTADPLIFTIEEYGGLVTRPWTASGVAGIVPIIVVESTLGEE